VQEQPGSGTAGPSDAELVARALAARTPAERTAAFGDIADRYRAAVLRWCSARLPDGGAAQDVGQATFAEAFGSLARGAGPRDPDRLGGWLIGIAKNQLKAYFRLENRPVQGRLLDGETLEDLSDDDESRSGGAVRRAHAMRLVDAVVRTLSERQQEVYQLRFRQELTGREMAGPLGVDAKTASNEATHVQQLISFGFGALILAQEGRQYCAVLAGILDEAAFTGENYTTALRVRITRHFDTCQTCDKCRVCAVKRHQLVGPYVPALIPVLFAAGFRERIAEVIRSIANAPASQNPPRQPGQGQPPAAPPVAPGQPRLDAEDGQPASQASRARSWLRRPAVAIPAGAAVVLAVLALLVVPRLHASAAHRPPASPATGTPGGSAPATLAYTTADSVDLRTDGGVPRVLATLPHGVTASSLTWSPDGKEVAWLTGTSLDLARTAGGPVQSWPCSGCQNVAFQGDQAVSVLPADGQGPQSLNAAIPVLVVFTPGRTSITRETITGIPHGETNTDFAVLTALSSSTLVVAYGDAGGSDLGGSQLLYHVAADGRATPYGVASLSDLPTGNPLKSGVPFGNLGQAVPGPQGRLVALTSESRGGACGETETAYLLDTATGKVTIPATPAGGGPDGFWVEGQWFDAKGNAYVSLIPNLTDCQTSEQPPKHLMPPHAVPIVCKLMDGRWVKTGTGPVAASYGPGGWLAQRTVTFSDDDPFAGVAGTLTVTHGTTRITVTGVFSFAWAP